MSKSHKDWLIGIVDKSYKHPGANRYTAFAQYLRLRFVEPPLRFRYFKQRWLAIIEHWIFQRFSRAAAEPMYPNSLGLMVQELWTFLQMKASPGSVFHSVKGEVDMHNLPRWSRLTKARLVITYHDALEQFALRSINQNFLREVDGIVALCETQRGFFVTKMPPERVKVVHHGVDTSFFRPGKPREFGATVISVGSYCRDHKVLSVAITQLLKNRPEVKIVLVGLGTRPQDAPEKFDDPRVTYFDGVSDDELLSLYHAADVALVSLWAATANNALLEAMSCGLPVVATDIGGIREYLGSNAGLLVTPFDGEAFASSILSVLRNPSLAKKMGAAGRERAERSFDYKIVAKDMQSFYDQIRAWPQAPQKTR